LRMGWRYDFDRKNKIIRIKELQTVVATATKDFTPYASPVVVKKVEQQRKVYALRNQFTGEYANGNPDLTSSVNYVGDVFLKSSLPAASDSLYGTVYLVRAENNFYLCNVDESGVYAWELYSYNVFDYEPEGANEEIRTSCTTIGNEFYSSYLDFIPRHDGNLSGYGFYGNSEATWGISLLFYYGQRDNKAGDPVCFACSGVYDSAGVMVGDWSLAFSCKLQDGTEVGLYERNWAHVLGLLDNPEQLETTIHLPRVEYMNLRFSDEIVIAGVKMLIKTIKQGIPYQGRVALNCVRV
jgi:hypothetical protein